MSIEHAIDLLYRAGWTALDTTGCGFHNARPYPRAARVREELARAGLTLQLSEVPGFDCHCAAWRSDDANLTGQSIGATADEAAIHALAQTLRLAEPAGV